MDNDKIALRLSGILNSNFEYDAKSKTFHGMIGLNILNDDLLKIKKLGLSLETVKLGEIDEGNSIRVSFKKSPQWQKWIIYTQSFTIVMIALQFAYIASKIVFFIK